MIRNLNLIYESRVLHKNIKIYKAITPISIVCKEWFLAEKISRCKIKYCNGRYNFLESKCITCGHIMESNERRKKRIVFFKKYMKLKE